MAPNKSKKKSQDGKDNGKQRQAHCKSCNTTHSRPVGKACTRTPVKATEVSASSSIPASEVTYNSLPIPADPLNTLLAKLTSMEKQQQEMLERITRVEDRAHIIPATSSPIRKQVINEPEVVPSLDFLRHNQDIQTEVAARIKQLDTRNTYQGNPQVKSTLKSGRYRSADTQINHYIAWPQEHVYIGPSRKSVSYDELTSEQFTLGYIRIMQRQQPELQTIMLDHLAKLLQSSLDVNSFESVRGSHAIILQEMERGTLNWHNTEEIEKMRVLYTNRVSTTTDSHKYNNESKRVVCSHYNSGKCKNTGDHQKDNITYRHICTYCYRTVRKTYTHPEVSCHRKQKGNATN